MKKITGGGVLAILFTAIISSCNTNPTNLGSKATLTVSCAPSSCPGLTASSLDSSRNSGGTKYFFNVTTTADLPANTKLSIEVDVTDSAAVSR